MSVPVLTGQKALVVGIANEHSIAWGCAKAFRELGADLAITYLNDKARPHVEPLAKSLAAPILEPLDVSRPGELESVFARIESLWGRLDLMVHSIAWAPKEDLQRGLLDCSAEGFAKSVDVSCHSFIRMARLAVPLMKEGGTMFAMSYHGANKVVPNYNVMGPVKAALEASCRYLAYELGPRGHPCSCHLPGSPQDTRRRRSQGLRSHAGGGSRARPARRARRYHGRRLLVRLPRDALRSAYQRRDHVRRRRSAHHVVTRGAWRRIVLP